MSKPRVTRIGCYAVITHESKLLACRLCGIPEHSGMWTLPGGGQEFGETLHETVIREVQEETGFHCEVGSMLSYNSRVFERADAVSHSFQFLFSADIIGGALTHETDGTTDLVAWVDLDNIDETNSVDIVLKAKDLITLRA